MREEISIKADGTGTYEISSDIIPMMRGMMLSFAKMDLEEGEELDSVELANKVEELVWKDFGDEIDSVLSLDDRIPPDLKSDPAQMAMIERTTMFMRGGRNKGYLKSGVNYSFENAQDLKDFIKLSEEQTKGDNKVKMLFGDSETVLKMTKNSFFRSTTQNQPEKSEEELEDLESMFSDVSILTVINTPKKIKKVKVKTYEIVERKAKSVTLQYKIGDILQGNKTSEISIEW